MLEEEIRYLICERFDRLSIAIGLRSDTNDFEAEHDLYREDAVLEYPQIGRAHPPPA